MKPSSILLRVLLSATLILNGIGSAVASAQMVGVAAATPAVAAADLHHGTDGTSEGACHEDATAFAPDGDAPAAGAGHGEHDTDCCKAGMCACHCMQQAQFTFDPPVPASPQVAHPAGVRAMDSAHETPRLPHLIRPPICQAT